MVRTTRMGQTGIRAILRHPLEPELKLELRQQLRAYDSLEEEAKALAAERNWHLKKSNTMLERMIEHMTWMKLGKKDRISNIADMMIQGNTQGMISSLRDNHRLAEKDQKLQKLNEKLIALETENIRQMKPFL